MDFLIILFLFLLPLTAIGMSAYCLIRFLAFKKAAAKFYAMNRLAGKDFPNE